MQTNCMHKQFLLFGLNILIASMAFGQMVDQSSNYFSQIDEDLTIQKVSVLAVSDNVDGIYSRPIQMQLEKLVRESHRWDFVESNVAGGVPTASELEENPDELKRVTYTLDADAFIVGAASRGPNGLSLRLDLFLKKDGKLLAQEILKDHPRFELSELSSQVAILYRNLIRKIPYVGLILSRQQNRVTVNLGQSDGLAKDQVLSVIQVIKFNRHPRFNFIISADKEVLGKIKILKVDETLSFGAIISEKEKGAVRKLAKVASYEDVVYQSPSALGTGANEESLGERPDAPISFGKEPKEWVPVNPPSFGQVGARVGLGTFSTNVDIVGTGSMEAKAPLYPYLGVFGELWLNPLWTVKAEIMQAVISTNNPREGGTPSTLNHLMTKYSMAIGRNFLLRDDFFGPKFQLSLGFSNVRTFVDESQPAGLTTTNYSAPVIGISGSFPLTPSRIWYMGGVFNLYVLPKLDGAPGTSTGSDTNTINEFSFFAEKKIAENLMAIGSLDLAIYGSKFSDSTTSGAATSLSQRHTGFSAGVVYQF